MMAASEHSQQNTPHKPVMLSESLHYLAPKDGGVYVDGTFGAGGHTEAILESANCKVFAIDRDPFVEAFVSRLEEKFADRFKFISGKFSDMKFLLEREGVSNVDGIFLDIGVSSMQIDNADRGFSFSHEGPLDMRMSSRGQSASDLINQAREEDLAGVIFKYGDERKSRRIARAIVAARSLKPITKTSELAEIIRKTIRKQNDKIDPATRTFQALRIWVNDELGELEKSLLAAEQLLSPGGRLVIITFHSGEDIIVKKFLKEHSGKNEGISRHIPVLPAQEKAPTFHILTRKAVKPGEEEIFINPRARSAKLRAAERTETQSKEI